MGGWGNTKILKEMVAEKKSCKEEVKKTNSCRVNSIVRLTNVACSLKGPEEAATLYCCFLGSGEILYKMHSTITKADFFPLPDG